MNWQCLSALSCAQVYFVGPVCGFPIFVQLKVWNTLIAVEYRLMQVYKKLCGNTFIPGGSHYFQSMGGYSRLF